MIFMGGFLWPVVATLALPARAGERGCATGESPGKPPGATVVALLSTDPAQPWEPKLPTKGRRGDVPPALLDPQVRLIGEVDYDLVRSLVGQLAEVSEEHDEVVIELTTP